MEKLKACTAVILVVILTLFTACTEKSDMPDTSALPDIQYAG